MNYKNELLAEASMSIALSLILNFIPIFKMPNGGSITLASSAPIIIFSCKHGYRLGLILGFVYSLFQLLFGFHFPPSQTIYSFITVIVLDYIISYTCFGLSGIFKKFFKNQSLNAVCGIILAFIIRLVCSVLSGVLVFSDYFPSSVPVGLYSLIYNVSYLAPECIITIPICLAAFKKLSKVS